MKREGFTLIELMIVLAIIAVLVAMLYPAIQMARGNTGLNEPVVVKVVRKYEVVADGYTRHRVDIRKIGGEKVEVYKLEIYGDSETINANIEVGHYYKVQTKGHYSKYGSLPEIVSIEEVPTPE